VKEPPVLFVTNHVPPARVPAFAALHERENVVFALFGGRARHAGVEGPPPAELPFPHRRIRQAGVARLAGSGGFRAVVAGSVGRLALPGAYAGARRARIPFVLWTALWAQPRTVAGLAGAPLLRRLYRDADAVATYGPHVSAYVRARGARHVFVAPQAVDNDFWSAAAGRPRPAAYTVLFIGRLDREKGVSVLLDAWRLAGLDEHAALVLVGRGPERARAAATRTTHVAGPQPPEEVRNFYAAADVVVLPSIPTRGFREPWGLVVNEAMNQGVPIIATDAVGAAAGGLVRHERNGLVVPAADAGALARAIVRLRHEPELRAALGAAAREDVRAYTPAAWAEGIHAALAAASDVREG
jgi:glycosyltransferase involved in cell wall biosynthesis